jgi:uncharacterized circularly permuted ATP-grasp superfamily protein
MNNNWQTYPSHFTWDEAMADPGAAREHAKVIVEMLSQMSSNQLEARQLAAEMAIKAQGITFRIYKEGTAIDRPWPFDIIPRIIPHSEWNTIEQGLIQRVRALNFFINDVYHKQEIVKDGVFPLELLANSQNFRPQCVGVSPANNIWAHICGSDLVRDENGVMFVLEDNLRVPSGVSYMLENRIVMRRVFPELFENLIVKPVSSYPYSLYQMLASLSPRNTQQPGVVVLTPGIYNSAYFEHSYLAEQMGCILVEGRDLFVDNDNYVYMKTIEGPKQVDVIYRRIDDLFLDPEAFLPDSQLGVPGLMRAWKAGKVALVNAPGAGVADDKVVYSYVPDMIRYYMNEVPILPNVPTFRCYEEETKEYVCNNLEQLVVKPANESGGYGLLIGNRSTPEEREVYRKQILENPRNYIAQPILKLSTVPTITKNGTVAPRHVDLRPFVLSGPDGTVVTTGGLTRVALVEGSLVVNSSQGGGSKDTWILEDL